MKVPNWEFIDKIEGWLFEEEAECLYKYALIAGQALEIGSWKGKSTCVLNEAGCDITVVDTFTGSTEHPAGTDTYDEFKWNTRGCEMLSSVQRRASDEFFAVFPAIIFDFVYVDGEHTGDQPKKDVENSLHHLIPGGYIVLHDAWGENGEEDNTPWPDVTRVALELRNDPRVKEVEKCRRIAVFQKL